VGIGFLNDSGKQKITADKSARRVEQHQISCPVGELGRSEHLQRQPEAATPKNGSPVTVLKPQVEEAVASDSFMIRRADLAGSIR
jgi:hypothetical protein